MGYENYPHGTDNNRDDDGRREARDHGRDQGYGRSYGYAGGRDDGPQDRYRGERERPYGSRDYGNAGYARGAGRDDRPSYGAESRNTSYGAASYRDRPEIDRDRGQSRYARGDEFSGSYASDGPRRPQDDGDRRPRGGGDYGRQPQGYDYDDRGFLARAGDEVRSWFGDEDAERRREADSRYDERHYQQQDRHERDGDYHNWRSGQIAALDRDYEEYRRENRSKFENEFGNWRTQRQTQRQSLGQVKEHAEVLGSDGSHVGTVDKVRGDRILLTKTDTDAGGQHHSIPSSWLRSVEDGKVTLSKTADEAKRQWRDEEQNQALFGDRPGGNADRTYGADTQRPQNGQPAQDQGTTNLNRSFSGTYDNKS